MATIFEELDLKEAKRSFLSTTRLNHASLNSFLLA